jgi:hypothetical protein
MNRAANKAAFVDRANNPLINGESSDLVKILWILRTSVRAREIGLNLMAVVRA